MEGRRAHAECGVGSSGEGDVCCEVIIGRKCTGPRDGWRRGRRGKRVEMWVKGLKGEGEMYWIKGVVYMLVVMVLAIAMALYLESS